MSNGIVHKYEEVIRFYSNPKNMEESRNYAFDFKQYAPNNYTSFLNNYTLDTLRGIARMCKDNAKIYGQIYWSVQNAQKIRLSANKEYTIFTLHNYLYYKYVALYARLGRPRMMGVHNNRLVCKIKKVIEKWQSKVAKNAIISIRTRPIIYRIVAFAAAKASDIFRKRMMQYKRSILIELDHLEYDLEEYEYQLREADRDVNLAIHQSSDAKEKKAEMEEQLLEYKIQLSSLTMRIQALRLTIGGAIKEFIRNYAGASGGTNAGASGGTNAGASGGTNSGAFPEGGTDNNVSSGAFPEEGRGVSIFNTLDGELEYILENVQMDKMQLYFDFIQHYNEIQSSIQKTTQQIGDISHCLIELMEKEKIVCDRQTRRRELVERVRNQLKITKAALNRKRKFPITVEYVPPEEEPVTEGTPPSPPQCPICLEDCIDYATTNCNHSYCKGCISKSLNSIMMSPVKPYICALCRTDVTLLKTADRNTKYQLDIKYVHTSCYV